MDKSLFDILACPLCKGRLYYHKQNSELICKVDKIAYPIRNDIPIMLEPEARILTNQELEELKQ